MTEVMKGAAIAAVIGTVIGLLVSPAFRPKGWQYRPTRFVGFEPEYIKLDLLDKDVLAIRCRDARGRELETRMLYRHELEEGQ